MYTAQLQSTTLPFVIRYPRGEGVLTNWRTPFEEITIGTGRMLKDGEDVAILTIGHPGNFATAAIRELRTQGLNPAHYDMRFVKPLDEAMLHQVFSKFNKVLTVEDGTVMGGFGSAILEFMAAHNYSAQVKMLGIPDRIVEHGTLKELHRECGYDAKGIVETINTMMQEKVKVATFTIGG